MLKKDPAGSACPANQVILVNDANFVNGLSHLLRNVPPSETTIKTLTTLIGDARRFYMRRTFGIKLDDTDGGTPNVTFKCPFANVQARDTEPMVGLPDSFHYRFYDEHGRQLHMLTLGQLSPSIRGRLLILVNEDTPVTGEIPSDSVVILAGKVPIEQVNLVIASKAMIYCTDDFATKWPVLASLNVAATGSDLLELDRAAGVIPWMALYQILNMLPYLCPAMGADATHQLLTTRLLPNERIYAGPSILSLIKQELSSLKRLDEAAQAEHLRSLFPDAFLCS